MKTYLDTYEGPHDVIDEVMDGKRTAIDAVNLLQSWSHFIPYTKDDIYAFAVGQAVRITQHDALPMPRIVDIAHVVKKTLMGRIEKSATARGWYQTMQDVQIAGCLAQDSEKRTTMIHGRPVFAGSVMPAYMAEDLLGTCAHTLDVAMSPVHLRTDLIGREMMQELIGAENRCVRDQTPVVLTALRINETTNEVALHAIPLRAGSCVINDRGMVTYVYDKPMGELGPQHIFFEHNRNGHMTASVVLGWPEEYQLRAGCESHAKLFVERALTVGRDQTMRRSLSPR